MDMRSWLGLLFVVVLAVACQSGGEEAEKSQKPAVLAADLASLTPVQQQAGKLLQAYYSIGDALVEADSSQVQLAASRLLSESDTLKWVGLAGVTGINEEMATALGSVQAETLGLLGEVDITEKRRSFSMLTEPVLLILGATAFSGGEVYVQECPMAFNDTETARWLSPTAEILNPYLGKKHPKYGSGMLHCGEVKDSLSALR